MIAGSRPTPPVPGANTVFKNMESIDEQSQRTTHRQSGAKVQGFVDLVEPMTYTTKDNQAEVQGLRTPRTPDHTIP